MTHLRLQCTADAADILAGVNGPQEVNFYFDNSPDGGCFTCHRYTRMHMLVVVVLHITFYLYLSGEGYACSDAPLRMVPAPTPIDALTETLIKGSNKHVSGVSMRVCVSTCL